MLVSVFSCLHQVLAGFVYRTRIAVIRQHYLRAFFRPSPVDETYLAEVERLDNLPERGFSSPLTVRFPEDRLLYVISAMVHCCMHCENCPQVVVFAAGCGVSDNGYFSRVHQVMHNLEVEYVLIFDDVCKGALKSMVGFHEDQESWLNQRGYCEAVMQEAESIQERDDAAIRALRVQKSKPAEVTAQPVDSGVLIQRIALAVNAMRSGADAIARAGNEDRRPAVGQEEEEEIEAVAAAAVELQ